MEYKLLDEAQVKNYAREKKLFLEGDSIFADEIGDGNINYVYRLSNGKKSYILKQSDELLRTSQRPLSQNRADVEAFMLNYYNKTLPDFAPKLHSYDKDLKIIIMEDLRDFQSLRKAYMRGEFHRDIPKNLAKFVVGSLMPTTHLYMNLQKRRKLQCAIINEEMCDITEDLVMTEPYNDYKKRNVVTKGILRFVQENIYNDRALQLRAATLKEKFINDKQSLIHGDLHTGSIFVKDGNVKVIDAEFATFAPMGYDMGNILGNMLFALCYHEYVKPNKYNSVEMKAQIYHYIENLNEEFKRYLNARRVIEPSFKDKYFINKMLHEAFTDMFAYAGMEILRRTIGDSKVEELTCIEDLETRQKVDMQLINFAKHLIMRSESMEYQNIVKVYEFWQSELNLI